MNEDAYRRRLDAPLTARQRAVLECIIESVERRGYRREGLHQS